MKCPKCGYQSFNNLTACKKCGRDLTQVQQKLNLGNPVVVPLPVQPPEKPIPAATEITAPPAPEPVAVEEQEQALPEDDHVLDDFFQSIDSLDRDQIPETAPFDTPRSANTDEGSTAQKKTPTEGPHWSQDSPQGDFPFEELASDLDALRLTPSEEPVADDASPFDDVDSFAINWQSPLDEEAIAKAEPVAKNDPINEPQSIKIETNREELQTIEEPVTEEPETVSVENILVPESTEAEVSVPLPITEPLNEDVEWPLPQRPTDHQVEKTFTLEEPYKPITPIEEVAEEAETPSPLPTEVQEELPLAAREIAGPAKQPNIAAIFLPDTEQDPIASGAQLLTLRAKAYLADLGLLAIIFALFICAGEIARSPAAGGRFQFTSDVLLDLAAPYFLVFFALCFGYFTLFHYLSGQTPGKMLFDVRVEGEDHASITLAQAFLRCVGGLISLLPVGLGFLSIVLNGEQRGWNDQLAGCRVVMLEELEED